MNKPSDDELRKKLTDEEYQVTQCSMTERPFTGEYWDCHELGMYECVVCGEPLFSSDTKFDSGTGWPSFWKAEIASAVSEKTDSTHGMTRVEIVCGKCGAHLGHVFPDGPKPTGLRYCVNSASLKLKPKT